MKDFYTLLGVQPDATAAQIREAYLDRIRVAHPDRFDKKESAKAWDAANRMAAEINEAYTVLKDPNLRARYDRDRNQGHRESSANSAKTSSEKTEAPKPPKQEQNPPPPPPGSNYSPDDKIQEDESHAVNSPGLSRFGCMVTGLSFILFLYLALLVISNFQFDASLNVLSEIIGEGIGYLSGGAFTILLIFGLFLGDAELVQDRNSILSGFLVYTVVNILVYFRLKNISLSTSYLFIPGIFIPILNIFLYYRALAWQADCQEVKKIDVIGKIFYIAPIIVLIPILINVFPINFLNKTETIYQSILARSNYLPLEQADLAITRSDNSTLTQIPKIITPKPISVTLIPSVKEAPPMLDEATLIGTVWQVPHNIGALEVHLMGNWVATAHHMLLGNLQATWRVNVAEVIVSVDFGIGHMSSNNTNVSKKVKLSTGEIVEYPYFYDDDDIRQDLYRRDIQYAGEGVNPIRIREFIDRQLPITKKKIEDHTLDAAASVGRESLMLQIRGTDMYYQGIKIKCVTVPEKNLEGKSIGKSMVHFIGGLTQAADEIEEQGVYYYIKTGKRTYPVRKSIVEKIELLPNTDSPDSVGTVPNK